LGKLLFIAGVGGKDSPRGRTEKKNPRKREKHGSLHFWQCQKLGYGFPKA